MAGVGSGLTAGASGCLGSGGDSDAVNLAYMPIFPDLQYFVMESQGYFDEIDAEIEAREFTDGPRIVQAYGSGEIDVAMFGIVPSMIVIDRGIPAKVTAANIKEPMAIMAHEEFQSLWEDSGSDAFEQWEKDRDRKFRFGTFPQGSVPDVLLRYWLRQEDIDPEEDVEITEINGANAVFTAMSQGSVDGASIMEPVPTRAEEEGLPVQTFKTSSEIMPGQPAAVTLMSDAVRDSETAPQFLRQHVRATEFIEENPEDTAEIVEEGIGMPADQALEALNGPLANFVTDPREIVDGTEIFADFASQNGDIDEELSSDQIFDHTVYEGL